MTDVPDAPFYAPPRWEGFLLAVPAIIIYVVSISLGYAGYGTVMAGCVAGIVGSIRICSPLWKYFWFWMIMIVLIALHMLLIYFGNWETSNEWSSLIFIPFTVADIVIILTIIYLLFVLIKGRPARLARQKSE